MHARIPRRNDPWSGRRAGDRCVVRGSAVTPKAGRGSVRAPGPGGCRAHGRPSGQSLDTGQLPARSAPQLGLSPLALCPTSQGDGPRNCTPLAGPPAALRPTRQMGTERPGAPTRGPRHGRCSQAPERGANTLPANVLRPRQCAGSRGSGAHRGGHFVPVCHKGTESFTKQGAGRPAGEAVT